jgi:hypothetical protein
LELGLDGWVGSEHAGMSNSAQKVVIHPRKTHSETWADFRFMVIVRVFIGSLVGKLQ